MYKYHASKQNLPVTVLCNDVIVFSLNLILIPWWIVNYISFKHWYEYLYVTDDQNRHRRFWKLSLDANLKAFVHIFYQKSLSGDGVFRIMSFMTSPYSAACFKWYHNCRKRSPCLCVNAAKRNLNEYWLFNEYFLRGTYTA